MQQTPTGPAPGTVSDWAQDSSSSADEPALDRRGYQHARGSRSSTVASPRVDDALSHWSYLVEGLEASTMDYYTQLEEALETRKIPDIKVRRVDFAEGSYVDARREYLRIERGNLRFDVCAAPFGTGYFFSWWLTGSPSRAWILLSILCFLLLIPTWAIEERSFGVGARSLITFFLLLVGLVGAPLLRKFLSRVTYYSVDRMLMFRGSVHRAVTQTIDELLVSKGLRALNEEEKKPIMRDLLNQ